MGGADLDVPAFVVGLSGLVALVDKSLIIWRSFAQSREFGNDMIDLSIKLSIEYYRYQDWASVSGALWSQEPDAQGLDSPDQARGDMLASLRAAVEGAVGQIIRIVLDISEISAKYGTNASLAYMYPANPSSSTPSGALVQSFASGLSTSLPLLGLQSGPASAAAAQQEKAGQLQNETPFHLRFAFSSKPWGESDKEALQKKIESLCYYNNSLETLLPRPVRTSLKEQSLASHLLATENRNILQSLTQASNHGNESVKLHAKLLKERIDFKSRGNVRFSTERYRREASAISNIAGLQSSSCGLSLQLMEVPGGGAPTVVATEWQSFEAMQWTHEDFTIATRRLSELVHLSIMSERPESLLTLQGICFVEKEGCLAFVHRLPIGVSSAAQPVSLRCLLRKAIKGFRPPDLNHRLRLAQQLASSIHSFGLVGWFHKDFNSSNITFFRDVSEPSRILLNSPYVVGLSISRPNKEDEKSLNKDQDAVAIYLHPDLRVDASQRRPSYHRKYDIYSLGLVLFEIGAWRPLDTIVKSGFSLSPADFKNAVIDRCEKDLGFYCGPQYREAVLYCLRCADDSASETDSAFEKMYWSVVLEISKLC